jgi:hypothetical protein
MLRCNNIGVIMMEQYLNQFGQVFKQVQKPLEELAALNIKTLQSLQTLKSNEGQKLNKPEALFEQQMALFFEAGHQLVDYAGKSFEIVEEMFLPFLHGLGQSKTSLSSATQNLMDAAMSNATNINPMMAVESSVQGMESAMSESMNPGQIAREIAQSFTPEGIKKTTSNFNSSVKDQPLKVNRKNSRTQDKNKK